MALKIRLRQQGRTNRTMYRLVVIDSRTRRDGAYLECLGWYNPYETKEACNSKVKAERAIHWLNHGAEMTEKAESILLRAAPEVIRHHRDRVEAKRIKERLKRKARKARKAA